jgi:hypothetical protein
MDDSRLRYVGPSDRDGDSHPILNKCSRWFLALPMALFPLLQASAINPLGKPNAAFSDTLTELVILFTKQIWPHAHLRSIGIAELAQWIDVDSSFRMQISD